MNRIPIDPELLDEVIEHIIHDNLPIAPIGNIYIARVGSKEAQGRKEIGTFNDKNHGEFVFVGSKKF